MSCADSRRLTGSLDLDGTLAKSLPNAARWDYGIGFRHLRREYAVWVEVHPMRANRVQGVLKKLCWLKEWLSGPGKPLGRMTHDDQHPTPRFLWLAAGPNLLPPHSPEALRASLAGMRLEKRLRLP